MGKGSSGGTGVQQGTPQQVQSPVTLASVLDVNRPGAANMGGALTNVSGQAQAESATPLQSHIPNGSFGQTMLPNMNLGQMQQNVQGSMAPNNPSNLLMALLGQGQYNPFTPHQGGASAPPPQQPGPAGPPGFSMGGGMFPPHA